MTAGAPQAANCRCGAEGLRGTAGWVRFFSKDICPACWQEQQRVLAEKRERRFHEERAHQKAWNAKYAEVADCARCGKKGLRVRMPRSRDDGGLVIGDSTVLITYWHKSLETGRDCRSEVDVEDVRVVERATRSRHRKQTPPTDGDQMT